MFNSTVVNSYPPPGTADMPLADYGSVRACRLPPGGLCPSEIARGTLITACNAPFTLSIDFND